MNITTVGELKNCRICPRNCGVDRLTGETGFCGAGENIRVARAALHQWEEPCISGERGSGTVFFSYCNLGCLFCQNHDISQEGTGLEITIERLSEIFLELQKKGAHNINLVTPTHYIPQIAEALRMSKAAGLKLPIVYNSSGYEAVKGLRLLEGLIDIYLPDVKFRNGKIAKAMANCEDYFSRAMEALGEMFRQAGEPQFDAEGVMTKGIVLRHLLLPGQLKGAKEITKAVFDIYGNRIFYSLMNQYTPMDTIGKWLTKVETAGREGNLVEKKLLQNLMGKIRPEDYEAWLDYGEELGIENGFIQEGDTAKESFIPAFDFEGVAFSLDILK